MKSYMFQYFDHCIWDRMAIASYRCQSTWDRQAILGIEHILFVVSLVVCKGVAHFSAKPTYLEYNSGIAIS